MSENIMTPTQLKARIEQLAPGTQAEVVDLTGTMDHYQAVIVSPAFVGKMMMEQHRMVYGLFKSEIDSERGARSHAQDLHPEQYSSKR